MITYRVIGKKHNQYIIIGLGPVMRLKFCLYTNRQYGKKRFYEVYGDIR